MCSALAGYGMAAGKARNWLHTLCFVGSLLAAIYVILEVEFPRRGMVRIDRHDSVLIELRETMK